MRYEFLCVLLLVCGCTVSEHAQVSVLTCPDCQDAYAGFDTCAFFEADEPSDASLIDAQNYEGVGIPIQVRGYMHHKFCFNSTHAAFGSANPTDTGLRANNNLVIRMRSSTLATGFKAEYDFLLGRGSGEYQSDWELNQRDVSLLFCPRGNCEQRIIKELEQATDSIEFAAFSFTSKPIAQALIGLQEEGVCVSGVMESFGARSKWSQASILRQHGVSVVFAQTPGLMHHKWFLIDGRRAIVGSYNPSSSANARNAETLVFISEPAVSQALQSEFLQIGGTFRCV